VREEGVLTLRQSGWSSKFALAPDHTKENRLWRGPELQALDKSASFHKFRAACTRDMVVLFQQGGQPLNGLRPHGCLGGPTTSLQRGRRRRLLEGVEKKLVLMGEKKSRR